MYIISCTCIVYTVLEYRIYPTNKDCVCILEGKKSTSAKIMKPSSSKPKARFSRYSDSEDGDDLDMDGSDSEYEEDVEVSAEFRAMAESFFNDATLEELISIDGCSKTRAEKIISLRPFDDFNELVS